MFEHFIDSPIMVSVVSSVLNDAVVITIDEYVLAYSSGASNRLDEEFKTDTLLPR